VESLQRVLRENWLTLVVIGGLVVGYFGLRSGSTDLASAQEYEALIRNGQGSVVYFFSNT